MLDLGWPCESAHTIFSGHCVLGRLVAVRGEGRPVGSMTGWYGWCWDGQLRAFHHHTPQALHLVPFTVIFPHGHTHPVVSFLFILSTHHAVLQKDLERLEFPITELKTIGQKLFYFSVCVCVCLCACVCVCLCKLLLIVILPVSEAP